MVFSVATDLLQSLYHFHHNCLMYTVYLYTCIYHFSVTTTHTVTVSDLRNCILLQTFVYMCYVERVTPDHLQGVEMPDYTFTYAICMDLLVRVCICVCIIPMTYGQIVITSVSFVHLLCMTKAQKINGRSDHSRKLPLLWTCSNVRAWCVTVVLSLDMGRHY